MKADVLKTIVEVRLRREESAKRELHAAAQRVEAAARKLADCVAQQTAFQQEIKQNRAQTQHAVQQGVASIEDVRRAHRRVDLIKDRLIKADETVRLAREQHTQAERDRQDILAKYLRIRAKREATGLQLDGVLKRQAIVEERRQAAAVYEVAQWKAGAANA